MNNRYHVLVLCTKQDISNKPFFKRGNHFLVQENKKDLPDISGIRVGNVLVSAILHYISLLSILPKSYFKISTFQPNCLCSSSFQCLKCFFRNQTSEYIIKCDMKHVFIISC